MDSGLDPKFDHLVIAVEDLGAATRDHARMLGREPSWRGSHPALGTRNTLFRLANGYVELLAADERGGPLEGLLRAELGGRPERPFALALGVGDLERAVAWLAERGLAVAAPAAGSGIDEASGRRRSWRSAVVDPAALRGLRMFLIEHADPPDALPPARASVPEEAAVAALDHLVVFSQDLAASRAALAERLGLAERWRRSFPERGTSNLGLDAGGVLLELIMRTDREPLPRGDVLWGVAYRVPDVDAAVARLRAVGIEASDARPGLAPWTRVANVRWERSRTLLLAGAPSGSTMA